jgi:hypothetical protein
MRLVASSPAGPVLVSTAAVGDDDDTAGKAPQQDRTVGTVDLLELCPLVKQQQRAAFHGHM